MAKFLAGSEVRQIGVVAMPDRSNLPEPLTPPECNLRGLPYMPVDAARMIDSDLYALSTGDEFKAAFTLFCKSFYQSPAGSLPSDEKLLEHLSGAKRWKTVRKMALRGWFLCSDGRLYHRTVAEKALDSWASRTAFRKRTEAARAARHKAHAPCDISPAPPVTISVTENVTTHVTDSKRTEQNGTEERKEEREAPAKAATSRASRPKPAIRLPDDWQPNAEGIALAQTLGLNVAEVTERFCDHFHTTGGRTDKNRDWDRRWIRWCKEDVEKAAEKRTRSMSRMDAREQSGANTDRRIAELEAELTGRPTPPPFDAFTGLTIDGELAL